MSKRNFGTTKCLLHFDFPYFNEPNDGLDDDVGLETWSAENSNVKLYGTQIPFAGTQAPKFGYRCIHPYTGGAVGTNTTGIWNMNSNKDYEIECFVFDTPTTAQHLLRLYNSSNVEMLTVSITTARQITVLCPEWGIISSVTSSNALTENSWTHIMIRVSNNTLKVFINGAEGISQELTQNVTLPIYIVQLGYTNTQSALYIDEFVFRHSAGTGNPKIPTHPYSGVLDISKVGGYGTGADGDVTLSSNAQINSYGLISTITDTKTFAVHSWNNGSITPSTGCEVMIHITAPKSTNSASYPLVGLYTFARIESLDGTNVVLSKEITTENGYDFTLDSSILNTYYVQAIIVPNYNSLTINSEVTVSPLSWSASTGGGIVAFRCKGDCTVNGSIITHGKGAVRYDLHQMTHSKLIDRFLCSQGGGIFIACGGTFTAASTARLGATWSGEGDGSNGAAGYGGNGGAVGGSGAPGGSGGVGGGGGGQGQNNLSAGDCGANASDVTQKEEGSGGNGGGGCGGKGGSIFYAYTGSAGGGGGGGQGGSGGASGYGYSNINPGQAGTINGGKAGVPTNSNKWSTGGGGGAPGGNGGSGQGELIYSDEGIAGASIILVSNKLKANNTALSTGGQIGKGRLTTLHPTGGSGGGGTGFCYIACGEQMS